MRRALLSAIVLIAASMPGGASAQPSDQLRNRPAREVACCDEWREPGPGEANT
jgi:hypothetical protein